MARVTNPFKFRTAEDAFYKGVKASGVARKIDKRKMKLYKTVGEGQNAVRFYRKSNKSSYYYVEYRDPVSGKTIVTNPIRGKKLVEEFIKADREMNERTPRVLANKLTSAHFRTWSNKTGATTTTSVVSILSEAKGMLKALYQKMKESNLTTTTIGPGSNRLLVDFAIDLRRAVSRGDWQRAQQLMDEFEKNKTNEEITEFYKYDDEDDYFSEGFEVEWE